MISVYADSLSKGRCSKCRHNIVFATETRTGQRLRLESDAVALTTGQESSSWRGIENYDAADLHRCA